MPRGSMTQFFAEHGGPGTSHEEALFWPGTLDGFPVRGKHSPHLRQDESEALPLAFVFQSRRFQLWLDEDKLAFDAVMNRIVNGWYQQHKRCDSWNAEHAHYCVWLEWIQVYGEVPKNLEARTPPHTMSAQP